MVLSRSARYIHHVRAVLDILADRVHGSASCVAHQADAISRCCDHRRNLDVCGLRLRMRIRLGWIFILGLGGAATDLCAFLSGSDLERFKVAAQPAEPE